MSVRVLQFEPKYQEQVKHVVLTVLQSLGFAENPDDADQDADLDEIPKRYAGRARFWVAIVDNKVVGTVVVEAKDATSANLRRMFVLPEYHGKGIGKMLLEKALSFARNQNYKTMYIKSDNVMTRAHAFYEKNGFIKSGENDGEVFFQRSL